MASLPTTAPPSHHLPSVERYAISGAVLVAGILVQYFPIFPAFPFAWEAELVGALITYGPGLVAFFALVGVQPLRNAFRHNGKGAWEGLRWYGILGILSILVVLALAILYAALDPNYSHLLNQNTPVDQEGSSNPILWMVLSFPIGLVEETLFRAFLFGGALVVFGTRRWKVHAVWTSLLFASVHLYYAQTYLEISPIYYVQIFLLGLAFAFAYFKSGGNLLVIALLHGAFDATSFAEYLHGVGVDGAAGLHYGFLLIAGLVALYLYVRESGSAARAVGPVGASPGGPWPGSPGFGGPLPPPPLSWGMPVPGQSPSVVPSAPLAGPPPGSPPPLPPPPFVPSVPSPRSAPSTTALFAPPLCRTCGAIVMGDLRGVPTNCPRCHAPLGGPAGVVVPVAPMPAPLPNGPSWHPVISAAERHGPPAFPPPPPDADPLEHLPVGGWPPSDGEPASASYHSAATLYRRSPDDPGSKGKRP